MGGGGRVLVLGMLHKGIFVQGQVLVQGSPMPHVDDLAAPAGVGMGMDPPQFLKPGDTVRCEIDGIGSLTNTVR